MLLPLNTPVGLPARRRVGRGSCAHAILVVVPRDLGRRVDAPDDGAREQENVDVRNVHERAPEGGLCVGEGNLWHERGVGLDI